MTPFYSARATKTRGGSLKYGKRKSERRIVKAPFLDLHYIWIYINELCKYSELLISNLDSGLVSILVKHSVVNRSTGRFQLEVTIWVNINSKSAVLTRRLRFSRASVNKVKSSCNKIPKSSSNHAWKSHSPFNGTISCTVYPIEATTANGS